MNISKELIKTRLNTIDGRLVGGSDKDCLVAKKSVKEILTQERPGPNFFLMGGPNKNYV